MPIGIIPAPAADAGAKSVRDSCNLICLPGYSVSRGSTSSSSSSVLHKFQHRRRRCLLLLPSFKWFTLFGLKVYQLGKCIYLIHTQTGASDWQTEQARQGKARQTSLRTQADMLTDRRGDRHTDRGRDSQTIRPTLRLDKELELELEQWRLGAEIKWLRARGNATLKRSFYAIFKSLSAATQALPSPPPASVCAPALQACVCVFVRAYVFVYNCRRSSLARESVYNFGLNNKTL